MDLWIRSQDKLLLEKVQTLKVAKYKNESFNELDFTFGIVVNNDYVFGDYATKERALEVLDEIQNKLKTLLYLKPNVLLRLEDIKAGKSYFEELNKQEFITCDNNFEIIPISTHVVVYEMPKE